MSSIGKLGVVGLVLGVAGCVSSGGTQPDAKLATQAQMAPRAETPPAPAPVKVEIAAPMAPPANPLPAVQEQPAVVQEVAKPAMPPAPAPDVAQTPDEAPPPAVNPVEPATPAVSAPAVVAPPKPVLSVKPPLAGTIVVADDTPRSFNIVAAEKDANHPFYGVGQPVGFVVDGIPGKELVVTRGVAYKFNVDSGVQHDFYFTTSPQGWGAGTISEGVKGQFIFKGTATLTPGPSTPAVMYYGCRNHKYMGGKINVASKGEKVALGTPIPISAAAGAAAPRSVSPDKAKQKVGYAEMLLGSSEAAKRIEQSANVEAKGLLGQARQKLTAARNALGAGDAAGALDGADEAMRLMSSATRLVPDNKDVVAPDAKYKDLLDQTRGFESSYKQNRERIGAKKGAELDNQKYDALLAQSKALADKGQYAEANKLLAQAQAMVTAALSNLLNAETMVYDKKFATPKDEYEHELQRYKSYEELIPVAIEQRQPDSATQDMMNGFVTKAKGIKQEAQDLAAKSDYKSALMALEAATDNLQRALQLAGVK